MSIRKNLAEMITDKMVSIHENEIGYKVWACKLLDKTTKQFVYGFYVQAPEGSLSEVIKRKRSKIEANCSFDWLMDYEGDFKAEDIRKVEHCFKIHEDKLPIVDVSSKLPFEAIYEGLCQYAERRQDQEGISIENGYCNIDVHSFKEALIELDTGYSLLEVKKQLRQYGLLRTDSNRMYDRNVTNKVDGQSKVFRAISFRYITKDTKKPVA